MNRSKFPMLTTRPKKCSSIRQNLFGTNNILINFCFFLRKVYTINTIFRYRRQLSFECKLSTEERKMWCENKNVPERWIHLQKSSMLLNNFLRKSQFITSRVWWKSSMWASHDVPKTIYGAKHALYKSKLVFPTR